MTEEVQEITNLMTDVHLDIMRERIRQNKKWGFQRHPLPIWYVILGEEYGELGQAIQTGFGWGKETDAYNQYEECIHIAAVAMAIAEQIKEGADRERVLKDAEKTTGRTRTAPPHSE